MIETQAEPEHIAISKSKGIQIDWKDGHHSRYGLQSCVTDGRPIDCLHSLASLKNGDTGECAQPCFQSSVPDWPESETTLEGRRKDCPGNYPNVCRCLGD